jgi:hypothetical protein
MMKARTTSAKSADRDVMTAAREWRDGKMLGSMTLP